MEYQKVIQVSKSAQQNISDTVKNEKDKEMPKERYSYPQERQKIIDNRRRIITV